MNPTEFTRITGDNVKATYLEYIRHVFGESFNLLEEVLDIRERYLHKETSRTILVLFRQATQVATGVFILDKNNQGVWVKRSFVYLSPQTIFEAGEMSKTAQVLFGTKSE